MSDFGALNGDGITINSTLLNPRNWRIQTIAGTFTSATLNITEANLENVPPQTLTPRLIAKSSNIQSDTYVS